jgi:hypothetical protein
MLLAVTIGTSGGKIRVVTDMGLLGLGPPAFVPITTILYVVAGVRPVNLADPALVSNGVIAAPLFVKL